MSRGAEKLKVGEAEILQVSGESSLQLQQQKIEVKSREEMMGKVPPQVAVIPPIIDLTRTPEYSQVEKLRAQASGDAMKGKSPSVLVGMVGSGSSGEMKGMEKATSILVAAQGKLHVHEREWFIVGSVDGKEGGRDRERKGGRERRREKERGTGRERERQ